MDVDTSPVRSRIVVIPEALAGARVDQALATCDHTMSRSAVQRLIKQGAIRRCAAAAAPACAGEPLLDADARVHAGERYRIDLPEPEPVTALPQEIPLVIRYEDAHLLVIDKAAGLVVHPGAGNSQGTLVNALLHHCGGGGAGGQAGFSAEGSGLSGVGGVFRPGIVHRLDKDTSGLLVVAKSDAVHAHLAQQFAEHTVSRRYLALVKGHPARMEGTVDAPIGRHPTQRTRMAVTTHHGRVAITHYTVLEKLPGCALIACRLETGRTHQIRVHLTHIGHPLLGDPVYGRPFQPPRHWPEGVQHTVTSFARQALHATTLGLTHPVTGERLEYDSPLPEDFKALLMALRSLGPV
ncbi:MAG: RluA family pseudouridine synthase [Magnetococcales bacterium]|nr:RluA family pseudouridine synthase [Magnetococcales bacterium]